VCERDIIDSIYDRKERYRPKIIKVVENISRDLKRRLGWTKIAKKKYCIEMWPGIDEDKRGGCERE
jgi:hypothetical protein